MCSISKCDVSLFRACLTSQGSSLPQTSGAFEMKGIILTVQQLSPCSAAVDAGDKGVVWKTFFFLTQIGSSEAFFSLQPI